MLIRLHYTGRKSFLNNLCETEELIHCDSKQTTRTYQPCKKYVSSHPGTSTRKGRITFTAEGRRWEKGVDSWNKYVHCSTRPHSWSHKRFPCFTLYFPLAFWIVQENYTFVKSEYSNNNTDTVNSPRDHSFNVLQFLYSVRGRTMTD